MTTTRASRLDKELADLATSPRELLVARWKAAYGRPPTSGTRRELLVASASWHLLARRLGRSSREASRRLETEIARVISEMSGVGQSSMGVAEAGREPAPMGGDN